MKKIYVLIELFHGTSLVRGVTENEKILDWWRKQGPEFIAIKRNVINTREDWIKYINPDWYMIWKGIK